MIPYRFLTEISIVVGLAAIFIYLVGIDFHETDTPLPQNEPPVEQQKTSDSAQRSSQVVSEFKQEIETEEIPSIEKDTLLVHASANITFSENVLKEVDASQTEKERSFDIKESEAKRVVVKKEVVPNRYNIKNSSMREKSLRR